MGRIDDPEAVCFKQLLLDAHAWESSRQFPEPVDLSEHAIGLDVTKDIGRTGTFPALRHTAKNTRTALIVWDREEFALLSMEWNALIRETGNIVRRILAEHRVLPMAENVVHKGHEIMSANEERYAA